MDPLARDVDQEQGWRITVRHGETVRVSWVGLFPRVELRREDGSRVVYKPRVSGHLTIGPLTGYGRVIAIGRGP